MLFNSFEFLIFFFVVFFLYWFVGNKRVRAQNLLIVIASYFFYGWWDWRFLSLIIISSSVDYIVGRLLAYQNDLLKRKWLLFTSIAINIGLLGFFKYFNFFIESFIDAFSLFGLTLHSTTLIIILPVGISFYTFQTLSYTIDVYRRKQKPTRDAIAFFAYVSFFPQLVAGPIERATNLLPQFQKKRYFDNIKAVDGLRQILLGLVKKVVIADGCAIYVNDIFANYQDYSGSTLVLGAILFAFQIYGDFSGYSDIAIGSARLLGFNLTRNFAYPYFSRDIAEFWRRWHITLCSWFRDYLYIPLGGSRCNITRKIRNVFIIFLVSGFWHGANWTFIVWGFLNALYFIPLLLKNQNRKHTHVISKDQILPSSKEMFKMLTTFSLICFGWIFFRAENLQHAFGYINILFSSSIFSIPQIIPKKLLCFIFVLNVIEWIQRDKQHAFEISDYRIPILFRWSFYYTTVIIIYLFGNFSTTIDFIYFQF